MKNANLNPLSVVPSYKTKTPRSAREESTGTAILDREYRVVWHNACATAHLGLSVRQVLAGESPLGAYLAAGEFAQPLCLQMPAGAVLSIEVLPFRDSEWLLLSRDPSAGARSDAMRRDFVADTSHELRAPLCVLTGLVETMSELSPDPDRTQQYLDLMGEQCKRMRNIVDGLLELSALEAMEEPGLEERVNVQALLARLRAEAEVLSGGRHTVVLNAQPGFDLLGAERDITSALGNLVANAIRYTQPGGEVRILWQVSAKGGEFIVEDTGIGIEAKHIPLLTERFYRVQKRGAQSRRGTGGAGLGLAIVKAVLSRHQAVLEISSEAGKGSRFVARFPLQRVAASRLGIASLAA